MTNLTNEQADLQYFRDKIKRDPGCQVTTQQLALLEEAHEIYQLSRNLGLSYKSLEEWFWGGSDEG